MSPGGLFLTEEVTCPGLHLTLPSSACGSLCSHTCTCTTHTPHHTFLPLLQFPPPPLPVRPTHIFIHHQLLIRFRPQCALELKMCLQCLRLWTFHLFPFIPHLPFLVESVSSALSLCHTGHNNAHAQCTLHAPFLVNYGCVLCSNIFFNRSRRMDGVQHTYTQWCNKEYKSQKSSNSKRDKPQPGLFPQSCHVYGSSMIIQHHVPNWSY